MSSLIIRRITSSDILPAYGLMRTVVLALSPMNLRPAFEAYVGEAWSGEYSTLDRIFSEQNGGFFFVATLDSELVGTFGMERRSACVAELRRFYVHPSQRRKGFGSQMLAYAEDFAMRLCVRKIVLTTSELQIDALRLYERAGYQIVASERSNVASSKTVGVELTRYHLRKHLVLPS